MRNKKNVTVTLKKATSSRLYEDIVSQIQVMIGKGIFAVGSQLPSERELSEQIGVSRNVLREAFRVLEHRGFIHVRAGSGRFVRNLEDQDNLSVKKNVVNAIEKASIVDAIAVRLILEPEVARQAAKRCTPSEAKNLLSIAKKGATWESNKAFHIALASISGNFASRQIIEQLIDLSSEIRQRKHYIDPQWIPALLAEHIAIAKAVGSGNHVAAAKLVSSHLKATQKIIQA